MTNNIIPYLCGGTFLCQILRARNRLKTSSEHAKCKKEDLSERETFRRLISIYQLKDFFGGTSLKTYTSKYKSCTDSLIAYTQFTDSDFRISFDSDIKTENSTALQMMSDFVSEFINIEEKGVQLVRCLLGMIKDDKQIQNDDIFYIKIGEGVTKKELVKMDNFTIEPFLLGVWHYIIMNRANNNENGSDTYKSWYAGRGNYCGTVGNDIVHKIIVKSNSPIPLATEIKNETLILPPNTLNSTEELYSESDKLLLEEFTADYDEIMLTMIGENYGVSLINMALPCKIQDLYRSKWNSKANDFLDLTLKSYIFGLLGELNTLSNSFLADNSKSSAIKSLRTKIRNLYVKLHPDLFAGVFPYAAFIDDWDDGEF